MSSPTESMDILIGHKPVKLGEIQVNEDGSITGFLFEYPTKTIFKLLGEDPGTIFFQVAFDYEHAEAMTRELENGG